jgi:hypothetical protein
MPIEREIDGRKGFTPVVPRTRTADVPVLRVAGLGREVILIEADDAPSMASAFRVYARGLAEASVPPGGPGEEPMLNAAASFDGKTWRLLVFPRRAHRPEKPSTETVSGGLRHRTSGNAGIIVTPGARFRPPRRRGARVLFREVSFTHAETA